ncbi:uncharacterized protein LOC136042514 [Artemia franciscana]|uniref:uncharacterized protein LOC136042514 n=1 Tax=Artemia franciscana TaxID=6661 RepID=UPI0032DB6286
MTWKSKTPTQKLNGMNGPVLQMILLKLKTQSHSMVHSHDLFKGLCKEIGLSGHIPHDMKVRWNSTYVMISSSLRRKSALQKFYDVNVRNTKIRELELTEQDRSLLECATSCLSPFEEATELASGSTYTTSSKAYMLIKGLVSFCEARSTRLLENRLKDQLLMQLKKYFVQNPRFKLELYQRAAYLDPCTYERMTLEERVAARLSLLCLLSSLQDSFVPSAVEICVQKPESLNDGNDKFYRFLNKAGLMPSVQRANSTSALNIENVVKAYEERVPVYLVERRRNGLSVTDPFDFWSQNHIPELTAWALDHFIVPTTSVKVFTSVPSEQAFSVAGYFVRKQCSRTSDRTLETRMFLSDKF